MFNNSIFSIREWIYFSKCYHLFLNQLSYASQTFNLLLIFASSDFEQTNEKFQRLKINTEILLVQYYDLHRFSIGCLLCWLKRFFFVSVSLYIWMSTFVKINIWTTNDFRVSDIWTPQHLPSRKKLICFVCPARR